MQDQSPGGIVPRWTDRTISYSTTPPGEEAEIRGGGRHSLVSPRMEVPKEEESPSFCIGGHLNASVEWTYRVEEVRRRSSEGLRPFSGLLLLCPSILLLLSKG